MKPESAAYLSKAEESLRQARTMLGVDLVSAAGRAAYYAAFHAAQALIFERVGKCMKRHNGVHSEFHKIANEVAAIDPELPRFLSEAYDLKTRADYEVGERAHVPRERAEAAIEKARQFVDCIARLLKPPTQTSGP